MVGCSVMLSLNGVLGWMVGVLTLVERKKKKKMMMMMSLLLKGVVQRQKRLCVC